MASTTLANLVARAEIDDHEEILKEANKAIKQSGKNVEAEIVRIVALLKLERYQDAVTAIETSGSTSETFCQFEKAYALYKLGNLEDAGETSRKVAGHRGAKHVEAQSLYRLENFGDASSLYQALYGDDSDARDEENDLRINLRAIDAQLQWSSPEQTVPKKPSREDLDVFETSFNAACRLIASGELAQAEVLLNRSKDLCNALDELSESQKAEELLPIETQHIFVLHKLGKLEAAEKLASNLSITDISDTATKRIAQNNQLAASANANPYVSQKLLQDLSALPKVDRLFQYQADPLQRSDLSLDLMVNKPSVVLRTTGRGLNSSQPTTSAHINKLSVLNAAAQAQNELGKLGLRKILPLIEKRPLDIGLVMTVIHLYLLTNNKGSAITIMQSLMKRLEDSNGATDQDVRFAPGLVAAATSLYNVDGRKAQVRSELAGAARYWRYKSKPPPGLLKASGQSLLESGDEGDRLEAQEIFNKLYDEEPTDNSTIAGFVAAYSDEPSKCKTQAEKLTSVDRLITGIDVTSLEAAGVPQDSGSNILNASQKRALEDKPKPVKKRIRKSRLPKDYNPNKSPDPERWLPLKDRSTYRPPKGKKGKQKTAALTQGGFGEKDNEKQEKPASAGVIQAPGGAIKASSKNKKKKGKK